VTNEDLNNLHYVSCVIKETLRLRGPANGTIRQIDTNGFKINGIHIPQNSILHVNNMETFYFYSLLYLISLIRFLHM
jgi:coumaroylquinate(coumaroylshikimate) 3'-monooxygenase